MALPGSHAGRGEQRADVATPSSASRRAIVGAVARGPAGRATILTPAAFANAVMAVLAVSGSINSRQAPAGDRRARRSPTSTYTGCSRSLADRRCRCWPPYGPTARTPSRSSRTPAAPARCCKQLGDAAPGDGGHRHRGDDRREPGGPCGGEGRAGHPAAERPAGGQPTDRAGPRQPRPRHGHRQAGGRRGPAARRSRAPPASSTTPCRPSPPSRAAWYEPGDVLVLRGLGPGGHARHGHGLPDRLRAGRGGPDRAGRRGHRRAAVRPGQQGHRRRRGLARRRAAGGPLGVVADGDRISIDLRARRADLLVDDAELARRHANRARHQVPGGRSGWLPVYARSVEPLPRGATLRGNDLPTTRP